VGDTAEDHASFRQMMGGMPVMSNREWQIIYRPLNVRIIEFEDVLFHHNSCVMMPARPSGVSSQDGSEDDWRDEDDADIEARQSALTGLDTIALVYRQFEFDPSLEMLIAGHTDTSGGTAGNFTLSGQRANNVLHILEGSRNDWADLCHARHKVEDFQQILTWVNQTLHWPCNPDGIDDDYGTNTRQATEAFIIHYNARYARGGADNPPPLASGPIMTSIRQSKRRRGNGTHSAVWPVELWRAVFDIYMEQLADKLGTNVAGLPNIRGRLRFVSVARKCAACGESFPVDDADREDYRSQLNRRVELLFFHHGELATPIDCQDPGPDIHTQTDCPIYHEGHFNPLYLDAGDLHGVAYHLRFTYYNRVRAEVMAVPEELQIQAVIESEVDGEDPEAIGTRTAYNAQTGVYTVIVQFATQDDADNKANRVQFSFETQNRWIHTSAAGANPQVVTRTPDQINGYDFAERWQYYDLPSDWASANWRCKVGNAVDTFENHRTTRTAAGSPIEFNLDAIVLLDAADGTQDIKDENLHDPAHADYKNDVALKNPAAGGADSRVKLFVVDSTTHNLKLYERTAGTPTTSRIPFPRNFTLENVNNVVIVHFRNGFYVVGDKRTGDPHATQPAAYPHIRGARAAIRHDDDCHRSYQIDKHTRNAQYVFTGDFLVHYFHHLSFEDEHPISFVIPHVSITFLRDTRAAAGSLTPFPSTAEVQHFESPGIYNAMRRWNYKNIWYEEKGAAVEAKAERIRVFYSFDEKETFRIADGDLPVCNFTDSANRTANLNTFLGETKVKDALKAGRGGRSTFLAFVTKDSSSWHWAGRPTGAPYSAFKLKKTAYQDGGVVHGDPVTNECGEACGNFTLAHELGHATSNPDEYPLRDKSFVITWTNAAGKQVKSKFYKYNQACEQYTIRRNYSSMMYHNQVPRLHHLWYIMHFVNHETGEDPGLKDFLDEKKFVARFRYDPGGGGAVLARTFDRPLQGGNPNLRANVRTPLHIGGHYHIAPAAVAPAPAASKELRLALYDTGEDESSMNWFHDGQVNYRYKGVIIVRVMMQVNFVNDSGNWTERNKARRLDFITRTWMSWDGKCRLVDGDTDLDTIYIHFLPGFTNAASGDSNYVVDFLTSTAAGTVADPRVFFHGGHLKVKENTHSTEVVRFLLNTAAGVNDTVALEFVRVWANDVMGPGAANDHYRIEAIPAPAPPLPLVPIPPPPMPALVPIP